MLCAHVHACMHYHEYSSAWCFEAVLLKVWLD